MENSNNVHYFCPLLLNSDIKEKVELFKGIYLEEINDKDIQVFEACMNNRYHYNRKFIDQFTCSNYKIALEDFNNKEAFDYIPLINHIIKLITLGSSGINFELTYVSDELISISDYILKPGIKILPATKINNADMPKLKEIIEIVINTNNSKYDLLFNKYGYAIANVYNPVENRFMDLMTILEMLYLPDSTQELNFRLSLRLAKMFDIHNIKANFLLEEESTADKFNFIKDLYNIRSNIVHNGEYKKFDVKKLINLINITRESLLLYIYNPESFEASNLNKILLD